MKKKKVLKNASLVALSTVMLCGTAVAFAGCGGDSNLTLSVSIFCNDSDAATNEAICTNWAKGYTQKLISEGTLEEGKEIKIDFTSNSNTETYFDELQRQIASNNAPDVFYVSPKYVKVWKSLGRILDLTEYFEKTQETADTLSDIWEDSLGFYGYSDEAGYTQGERITYDATAGVFKTSSGKTAGLYGLPKDYSNFGLGFNNKFFSQKMRTEYTTRRATEERSVKGAEYNTATINSRGAGDGGVITYAVDGDGFRAGDDAPIINIGIPTTYKPYNFYSFADYNAAVAGGDPMALSVERFTNGQGYTVTIPGFPGDTFEMPANAQAEGAVYDKTIGHVTYTYAEYGALTWALTYYLNTFAWDNNQTDPLKGQGGSITATGTWQNVYGNDQYDGVLYLLPWLAGNDADYIDRSSKKVVNGSDSKVIGTNAEDVLKLNITGNMETRKIQYGLNSENFIETYGAFLAYGSDWNGNSNNAGDTKNTKSSGWDLFCSGSLVFYGAGTWDAATRNQSDYKYLQFRNMPEPVGEKYALYSEIKDANYSATLKEYGEKKVYSQDKINEHLALRQDKWGARMDSVGYGVNSELKTLEGDEAWKAAGAAALVMDLTINKDVQKTLTYSGAQLPNFKSQCVDFLNYQKEGYQTTGAFSDMITPDGNAAGEKVWDEYYNVARALYDAAKGGNQQSIQAWMEANAAGKSFDPAFASDAVDSVENLAYAMKVLRMTTYTYADRDLSLRMQTGLNAVRDSSMYTYESKWLAQLEGRGTTYIMAYLNQTPLEGKLLENFDQTIVRDPNTENPTSGFGTPQWFCLVRAGRAQKILNESIEHENAALGI